MTEYRVKIYVKSKELPELTCRNFLHSTELFGIVERSSGQTPYMVVAFDTNGNVVAHLLALVRRRGSLLPPYLFTQGRIYGEGEYEDTCSDKEKVFGMMLNAITRKFRHRLCLFVEFSDLSQKMFGYRYFRSNGYFYVNWQEVHNSLHSRHPAERLTPKTKRRIDYATSQGVSVTIAKTERQIRDFFDILNRKPWLNFRRFIPPYEQFLEMALSNNADIFVTTYKNRIIGGCACTYSEGNAYLWFLATRSKRYINLHPDHITLWHAILHAYKRGESHFRFLDAGLPTRTNPYRSFILSFGGKPVGKYRWFRFSFGWINRLLSWFYEG